MRAHNVPVFDDELLEIDEVLDSIAWDLCGHQKLSKRRSPPGARLPVKPGPERRPRTRHSAGFCR